MHISHICERRQLWKRSGGSVPVRVTVAVMKQHDEKQVGEKWVYFVYTSMSQFITEEVRVGTHAGQEAGGRSWRSAAYWLGPYGLLSLLLYRTQDQQPRSGTTYSGLGLLPSISN